MLGNDKNPIREGGEITPDLGVRGDTREQGGGTWGQRGMKGEEEEVKYWERRKVYTRYYNLR